VTIKKKDEYELHTTFENGKYVTRQVNVTEENRFALQFWGVLIGLLIIGTGILAILYFFHTLYIFEPGENSLKNSHFNKKQALEHAKKYAEQLTIIDLGQRLGEKENIHAIETFDDDKEKASLYIGNHTYMIHSKIEIFYAMFKIYRIPFTAEVKLERKGLFKNWVITNYKELSREESYS
jgi:hypothetical protein